MTSRNDSHVPIGSLFESARMNTLLDAASQAHLEGCNECRTKLSWMETAARLGSREMTYEPAPEVLNQVLGLVRTPGRMKQLRNFILASLSFDSFAGTAPAGLRANEAAARQLTYEADDIEIALSITGALERTFTITGQVISKSGAPIHDSSSASADLVDEGDHIKSSALSNWGEFMFEGLSEGDYDLQMTLDNLRVVRISSLSVRR